MIFKAKAIEYETIACVSKVELYPYIRSDNGDKIMWQVSPIHGRSFIVNRCNDGHYVVSKGNGLGYTRHSFVFTPDMPSDVLGLLLKEDALRDYYCGLDVQALGIKTNQMECVLELDCKLHIPQTGMDLKPVLLQYNVECPYRIADAPFMSRKQISNEVLKWEHINSKCFDKYYLIAANVMINNLRIMHDNKVLHNALTNENITWALELLDLELTRTPQHPYTKEDYERHCVDLYDREVLDTYKIILYIAGVLNETVDYKKLDNMFLDYGFDISKFCL